MRFRTPNIFLILMLLLASLIVGACTAESGEANSEVQPVEITTEVMPATPHDDASPDIAATATPEEQPALAEAPTEAVAAEPQEPAQVEAVEQPQPPQRGAQLEATNPETVVLASGEIQLVEFFAFW